MTFPHDAADTASVDHKPHHNEDGDDDVEGKRHGVVRDSPVNAGGVPWRRAGRADLLEEEYSSS